MSLRPRYSLLTLLVLTALVAGGTWYWFKPTRFEFDLLQDWDYAAEHGLIEEDLRRAAAYTAGRHEGSLVYDARRSLAGSKEFLAAKYRWKNSPTLARFTRPQKNRADYLLTYSSGQALVAELQ